MDIRIPCEKQVREMMSGSARECVTGAEQVTKPLCALSTDMARLRWIPDDVSGVKKQPTVLPKLFIAKDCRECICLDFVDSEVIVVELTGFNRSEGSTDVYHQMEFAFHGVN